jgi:N-acetylneuraminic acid mutarotase
MRGLASLPLLWSAPALTQVWTRLPDHPGVPRDDASSFVIGTKLYVGTGMDAGFQLTNDWWCFDASTESWSAIAALPSTGRMHCAAFAIDGRGYLFGGVDANGYLNELWCYDPNTDDWTQGPSLPGGGRMSHVAFTLGDTGYIATGRFGPDEAITNELWAFVPGTGQWTQRASLPGDPRLLGAACADDAYGYLFTGQDAAQQGVTDAWRYDPVNNAWSALPACIGAARFAANAFMVQGTAHVLCGATTYTDPYLNDHFGFATASQNWSPLPVFIGAGRKGASGGYVTGHGLYFGLGSDLQQRFTDWYRYGDPVGVSETSGAARPQVITLNDGTIRCLLPARWTDARAELLAPDGRCLSMQRCTPGVNDVVTGDLPTGIYMLRLTQGNEAFIQRCCIVR